MIPLRAGLIWIIIAILAIANGALRDLVLAPIIGLEWALPISGISLSLIILLVTHLAFPFIGAHSSSMLWLVGLQWVAMTMTFEFGFGHYVMDKSWEELLNSFDMLSGDLFLMVLFVSLAAPSFVNKIRH
jgi:hypothetical protein